MTIIQIEPNHSCFVSSQPSQINTTSPLPLEITSFWYDIAREFPNILKDCWQFKIKPGSNFIRNKTTKNIVNLIAETLLETNCGGRILLSFRELSSLLQAKKNISSDNLFLGIKLSNILKQFDGNNIDFYEDAGTVKLNFSMLKRNHDAFNTLKNYINKVLKTDDHMVLDKYIEIFSRCQMISSWVSDYLYIHSLSEENSSLNFEAIQIDIPWEEGYNTDTTSHISLAKVKKEIKNLDIKLFDEKVKLPINNKRFIHIISELNGALPIVERVEGVEDEVKAIFQRTTYENPSISTPDITTPKVVCIKSTFSLPAIIPSRPCSIAKLLSKKSLKICLMNWNQYLPNIPYRKSPSKSKKFTIVPKDLNNRTVRIAESYDHSQCVTIEHKINCDIYCLVDQTHEIVGSTKVVFTANVYKGYLENKGEVSIKKVNIISNSSVTPELLFTLLSDLQIAKMLTKEMKEEKARKARDLHNFVLRNGYCNGWQHQ